MWPKIPVLALLCCIPAYAVGYTCDNNPIVNGCSIPGGLTYFYKNVFKPACNKHDICYNCATDNSLTRFDCDNLFYANMVKLCKSQNPTCYLFPLDYYTAVRAGGASHFLHTSPSWCSQSWVSDCLN